MNAQESQAIIDYVDGVWWSPTAERLLDQLESAAIDAQEQAAIDAHPNWERDFDADRRERESVLVPLTAEAVASGEAELKRLMEGLP